jgi:tetratricopeptide (TPR) repeat protein
MNRVAVFVCLLLLVTANCLAQQSSSPPASPPSSPSSSVPPSSAQNSAPASHPGESSSRETRIDLSPPPDDTKTHPESKEAVRGLVPDDSATSTVQEFHPWNPLKAKRDIDVGDFYFRRKNYKAALDRYQEALYYKDGDAIANFRLAECQEKLGDKAEAKRYYEQYLKILPEGPLAKNARASLDRLAKERLAKAQ